MISMLRGYNNFPNTVKYLSFVLKLMPKRHLPKQIGNIGVVFFFYSTNMCRLFQKTVLINAAEDETVDDFFTF